MQRARSLVVSALLVTTACGQLGTSCGCAKGPLPEGGVPRDQTVEGGGQLRLTESGFTKLTAAVPAMVGDRLGDGFCVGQQAILGADVCYTSTGPGGRCSPGCYAAVNVAEVRTAVTSPTRVNLFVRGALNSTVIVDPPIFNACSLTMTGDLTADADVDVGIDPGTGELTVRLARINDRTLSNVTTAGCGAVTFLAELVASLTDSFLAAFTDELFTPAVNEVIEAFVPAPQGIAATYDLGPALAPLSPGAAGALEVRVVPGGYVQLAGGGMTLGLVTGLNSDRDPSTRTAELDGEPAECVPPLPAPALGAPPASLPSTTRGTFVLAPAGVLGGQPDADGDLVIGFSETALDLLGHHLVASGALCAGVNTAVAGELTLGRLATLVPSLGELGDAGAPVLVVARPQAAADLAVGDGTGGAPHLTVHLPQVELDLYVFIHGRYARAFTLAATLDVGIGLAFVQQPGLPASLVPSVVSVSPANVTVLAPALVREGPAQLAPVMPAVLELVVPHLAAALGTVEVPAFAGFMLVNLRAEKVITSEDEFLAVRANLGPPVPSGASRAGSGATAAPRGPRAAGSCGHGGAGIAGLLAAVLVAFVHRRTAGRRARPGGGRAGVATSLVLLAALGSGCSCGGAGGSGPPAVAAGTAGAHSDLAVLPGGDALVSAYEQEHGDLVVARVAGVGRIPGETWEYVDGVPGGPAGAGRGGSEEAGPDVGLYTSVAAGAGTPMVAYFARDEGSLKFAARGAAGWRSHVVDAGTGAVAPEAGGERAGLYAALTTDPAGAPAIAYLALTSRDGAVVAEVRWAEATSPAPDSPEDWSVTVLDSAPLPAPDPEHPDVHPLPPGLGLFVDAARDTAGNAAVVYHDRARRELVLVRREAGGAFGAPRVLASSGGEEGGQCAVAVLGGAVHVAYQGADRHELLYLDVDGGEPERVDDGRRIAGTTAQGLPRPERHVVGADLHLLMTAAGPCLTYQDSTAHALVLACRGSGGWSRRVLAGAAPVFAGAFGFYASAALSGEGLVVSTWAVHPAERDAWVEVLRVTDVAGVVRPPG